MDSNVTSWSVLIFLIPLQIVIVMRTIALWNRNRVILYLTIFSALATDIALTVLLVNVSRDIHFFSDELLTPVLGCFGRVASFSPENSTAGWGIVMAFDFTIFNLTLLRAPKTGNVVKYERTPLLRVLVVDGFVYYCVMLVISIFSLMLSVVLNAGREGLLVIIPSVMKAGYCIVGSRIAFHLRESLSQTMVVSSASGCRSTGTADLSLRFASSRLQEATVGSLSEGDTV